MPDVNVHFKGIKKEIQNQLSRAKSTIKIAVAWFTDEDLMSDLIEIRKISGGLITIQVIISNAEENFQNRYNLDKLVRAGVELRVMNSDQPFLHHKFCLVDSHTIINGSYNWTYYAASKNEENITVINVESGNTLFTQFNAKFSFYYKDERSTIYSRNLIPKAANLALGKYDEEEIMLRQDFQQEIKDTIKAVQEINPTKPRDERVNDQLLLHLIERYGDGVTMVKKLLRDPGGGDNISSGLQKLALWGELKLSFEHKALKQKYRQLFTEAELTTCQTLLNRLSR